MLSLTQICENNFVNQVLSLPPLLKEKLLGISLRKIRKEIKGQIEDDIKKSLYEQLEISLPYIIENELSHKVRQRTTPYNLIFPEYENLDNDSVLLGEKIVRNLLPVFDKVDSFVSTTNYESSDSQNVDSDYDYP